MAEHCRLKCFFFLLIFGFPAGMTMAVIGFSSEIAVGIAGIAILIIIFIVVIVVIIAVIRGSHMLQLSPQPVVEVEAENMNLNMPISTVTLEERSTTAPQPYEMTLCDRIRAMQSGVVAIGTQPGYPEDTLEGRSTTSSQPYEITFCNWIRAMQYGVVVIGTQPGYPEDTLEGRSTTAPQPYEITLCNWIRAMQYGVVAIGTQPGYPEDPIQFYSLAAPNLLSAPWCPPVMLSANNPPAAASIPYSQPGAASPVNYTAPYPAQLSTDSDVAVANPTSQENDIVPPPSYNDVMTGNVKYDEVQEMNPERDQLS